VSIGSWNATMLKRCAWCAAAVPWGQGQTIQWRRSAAQLDYAFVCEGCFQQWRVDGVLRERVEP